MTQVVTFERVRPIARGDGEPWTHARIEEAETEDGTYAEIETIDLSTLPGGLDSDPLHPAARTLTTNEGAAPELWYQIVFVDGDGNESTPTAPIQNTSTDTSAYTTVDELQRVLKITNPTDAQIDAMNRVLVAAAGEINSEIDRADDDPALAGWQIALCAEVNLERAVEHWQQGGSAFGLMPFGGDLGGGFERIARDTWDRHAHKLAPLKSQWGIA